MTRIRISIATAVALFLFFPAIYAQKPSASVLARASAVNDFGFDFWRIIKTDSENAVFSALSINQAMAVVWAGASGENAAELAKALRLEGDPEAVMKSVRELAAHLEQKKKLAEAFLCRNRTWFAPDLPVRQDYKSNVRTYFGAEAGSLDFSQKEASRAIVDGWVKQATDGMIPNIVPDAGFSAETRWVIVNAVRFKSMWEEPFLKTMTYDSEFTGRSGTKRDIPFMNGKREVPFLAAPNVKIAEIPYVGGEFAFLVLLPRGQATIENIEKELTGSTLSEWRSKLKKTEIEIRLPKLKLESHFDLVQRGMKEIGITRAISGSNEWDRLSDAKPPLFLNEVRHKAVIEVDEEGTRAAAATIVETKWAAPDDLNLDCRRPFLFAVIHRPTGLVTFLGRFVEAPAAKS